MPTYEYECSKCGAKFEMIQSMSEPAKKRVRNELKSCTCDAPVTRCVGTGAGVIFKGSGFYQTDYRSESYKQAAKADKESSEAKAPKDSSDAKPGKEPAAPPAAKGDKPSSSSAESKTTKNESAGHPKSQAKKSRRSKDDA